jgi:hypothetical protein
LSDVRADSGRSPDSHSAGTNLYFDDSRVVCLTSFYWRAYLRNEESPDSLGSTESAKVSLVGTAQRPGRQTPLTGDQTPKGSDRVGNTEGKRPEESLRESLG